MSPGHAAKPRGSSALRKAVRAQVSREEGRRFEQLVAELSAALVGSPAGQIDREIARWLKQIVLTLDLDRSSIGQLEPHTGAMQLTHQWSRPGVVKMPLQFNIESNLPWYARQLFAGREVIFSNPNDLPAEAQADRANIGRMLPRSHYACPFKVGGKVVGVVGFGVMKRERSWPPRIAQRLRLVAEIFGNAVARKQAAAEVTRLREELTHVARASTMGELAASIAHELNQPLTAILNNAEVIQSLLEADPPDLAEIKAAVADIVEDDTRAGETIRRLREFFRRGEIEKSTLMLTDVVRAISRIVQNGATVRSVLLTIDAARTLPAIMGDRIQLQQAIINLIFNAFDAVSEIQDGPREVKVVTAAGEPGWVRLAVHDSGVGIAADAAARIFEPFFTTRPTGMGMGLAISRSIVEAHGGRLNAAPNPPRGTIFTIELPAQTKAPA